MNGSGQAAAEGLLERAAELQRFESLCEAARRGSGSVAVVEGAPGIGKSELLAAVNQHAEENGCGVLRARGSEFEADMAFGVARQLFEPMLMAASPGERRRLVGGVARMGARALGVEVGEPPADRFAAIHGLYWLCANRAERGPLVVLVDDAQWVDDPSLAWLGYLGRRARDLPVLLVLGLRSGDPGSERSELERLVGDDAVHRITPGPLSAAAVAEVVRAQLDADADEQFCAACSELTRGNPLFVRELLAAARAAGLPARAASVPTLTRIAPPAVGPSVLARLSRMGAEVVALARAVAVLGSGAEVVVAAELAELDPVLAELTADRLAAAQIFAPQRPLEFFHPLIAAAVLQDLAPGARRLAHRRAAALVDGSSGSRSRVAAHLLACGPAGDGWVVQRLRAAADEALDRGAPEVAAGYLRRALEEPPEPSERATLLLILGTAEWRARQPEAMAHLEQALACAGEDPGTWFDASWLLALAYIVTDRAERAVDMFERLRVAVGDSDPRLALTLEASIALVGLGNERTAGAALLRAEELRQRLPTVVEPPPHLLIMLANYAARTNRAAEAQALTERALAFKSPRPRELSIALLYLLMMVERYETLRRLCEELVAAARRQGAMQELIVLSVLRAWASAEAGELADAEADARWALERAKGVGRAQALSAMLRVLVERDALDEAERLLDGQPDPSGLNSGEAGRFLGARGRLRAAQGRLPEALTDLLECGERNERLGFVMLGGGPWRVEAALVHAALGNQIEARRLADEQLELARAFGLPRALGVSLRASGLVQGGPGGLELLAEAVHTLEHSCSPLEFARAMTDYGAALRRAGHRGEARAQLERGLDLAHHLGARRIANQARAELIAAGAKPRRDAITGRDALTAGELRVARLAADGLTNREVAQALFITTMTAKGHLSRVYRKLGITRRGQLAPALASRLGAPGERSGATGTIIS